MMRIPVSRPLGIVFVAFFAVIFTLSGSILSPAQTKSDPDNLRSGDPATSAKGGPNACPTPPAPVGDTTCYAGSGCLDVSFDNDGLVTTFLNNYQANHIHTLLIQPDGKIVGVGFTNNTDNGTSLDFFVIRYNADGSLDTTFGDFDPLTLQSRGYTKTALTTDQDRSEAGALQADGKILAGGYSNGSWAVSRYNSDGTLDTTFDGDGIAFFNLGSAAVRAMTVQADGKILLTGEPNFSLMRLNTDGTPDSTFGVAGKLTINPTTSRNGGGTAWSIATQRIPAVTGAERIVIGGAGAGFAIMRFMPTGALDTSFGTSGRVNTSFSSQDQAREIGIDSMNRIVAGGIVTSAACTKDWDFGVARYTQNGVLDTSFSGDGKVSTDVNGRNNNAFGLDIQADDKILIGGESAGYFAMVRYNVNGTADNTFGPGFLGAGVVTTNFGGAISNWNYSIAIQPDGRIVTGGVSLPGPVLAAGRPAVARYLP